MINTPQIKSEIISKRIWLALLVFGLFGQIAWTVENMYFNVFLYETVTYDPNATAIMVAASAITATLTTLIMGVISDRMGKRRIFINIGYIAWGIIILLFAFVSKDNTRSIFVNSPEATIITITVAMVVVLDCVMTFFGSTANDAAFNAWVTDVTSPSNRGRAEGLLQALPLIAMLVVFGAFDPLIQAQKWEVFYVMLGLIVICGGIIGIFIIRDADIKPNKDENFSKNLFYGFKPSVIKKNYTLYIVLTAILILCTSQQVFMPYMIIFIEHTMGITDYAFILAGLLIMAAIISILLGRLVDKFGKHKFIIPAVACYIIFSFLIYLLSIIFIDNKTIIIIGIVILGAVMMGSNLVSFLILNASLKDNIPDKKIGHYQGVRMVAFVMIPMIIGPFIGSIIIKGSNQTIIDAYGAVQIVPTPAIFLGAAIVGIFALVPIILLKRRLLTNLPKENLLTVWGENLDNNNVLSEYPRPQLARDSYINLNGLWDYAIVGEEQEFDKYDGSILVPFSPESLLSGVMKEVKPSDTLYYRLNFDIEKKFIKDKTILNFGAVDYECKVLLNGIEVGSHKGGYVPFSIDVTSAVQAEVNELQVIVTDPSDEGYGARGKQKVNRGGIWYTPQSGIWQTVWLESVDKVYISSLKMTPDIDKGIICINPTVQGKSKISSIEIMVGGKVILADKIVANQDNIYRIDNFELWSPEKPHLYSARIIFDNDTVDTYFGMRKFSVEKSSDGYMRCFLNNKPYFHKGVLDQGYWSDGMLTPPSNEALEYDIQLMKDMGFNMIRKHIKIEPLLWYYYCDKIGILVWQDMINGGSKYNQLSLFPTPLNKGTGDGENKYKYFSRLDAEGREEYYRELDTLIDVLYNTVSIAVWVPFNEGWGQFDSLKAVDFIKERDTTRIIDHASGWHDQGGGDLISKHTYFIKLKQIEDENRAYVISEYGGYSHKIDGHVFNNNIIFGYRVFKDIKVFQDKFASLMNEQVYPLISTGLSGVVYTQLSDVEDEINGLITYDRKVIKVDMEEVRALNEKLSL